MAIKRRNQCTESNLTQPSNKVAKFLKEAKDELDPVNYVSLIQVLTKCNEGNFRTTLENASDYMGTLEELEIALQNSERLIQRINSMLPSSSHIGTVIYSYSRLNTLKRSVL